MKVELLFDQFRFATGALAGLLAEGALGAALTGIVVLVSLRDLRAAMIPL